LSLFIQTLYLGCTHICFFTYHYSYEWNRHKAEIRRIRHAETGVSIILFSYRHIILAVPTYLFSLFTTHMYGIDIDPKSGGLGVRKLVSPFVSISLRLSLFIQTAFLCYTHICLFTSFSTHTNFIEGEVLFFVWSVETRVSVCLISYRHLIFAVPTHVSSLITTQIYCTDIDQKFER
jgi:hypothetical protein